MTLLRWEKQACGSIFAYSGDLRVAMIGRRDDGSVFYSVDAVHMKWIAKGHGEVKSIAYAKRAVEKAWAKWLEHADLVPRESPPSELWRRGTPSMPDMMRMVYTSPELTIAQVMRPDSFDRMPDFPVFCVIGPFDNHLGQQELQERLTKVMRQWNSEAVARAEAAR